MQYMFLIYDDETGRGEDANSIQPWIEYTAAMQQAGYYIAGAGLLPTETATTVRVRNGDTITSDGPFAETKEQLGGYYLVDCENLDQALEWAAKMPNIETGSVEVRPVFVPPTS